MVQAIPEGVSSVVPYLCVRGAKKAIAFYQAAFGAEVVSMMPMGDLVGHADLKIGGSRVYLADEMPAFGALKSPQTLKGSSVNLHFWTEDCDAAFARAVAAGARVIMPLTDQFWGDRYGMVSDPFGHAWAITSHKEDLTPEEMMRRGQEAMAQMAHTPPPAPKPKARRKAKGLPKAAPKPAPKPAAKAPQPRATVAPKAVSSPKTKAAPEAKKDKNSKKSKKEKSGKKGKKSKKDKKRKKKSKR